MSTAEQPTYSVGTYGIADFEREVLRRILAISTSRACIYRLAPSGAECTADVVLVDRDDREAVAEFRRAAAAASRHAGTILVAKEPPERHPFHVRRPFMATRLLGVLDQVVATLPPRASAPPTTAPPEPAEDDRYRALVVDDSMAVRKQIGLVLERAAVAADFASDGEAALELISQHAYDVVFLDVVMPGRDGYDVCKRIKRDRTKKHVPVVMLTGRSSPFDKVKGKLSGCDTYLTKPVSRDDFTQTLKKYLKEPISPE